MRGDVDRFVKRCITCIKSKSKLLTVCILHYLHLLHHGRTLAWILY
jgi:hypothetical protein